MQCKGWGEGLQTSYLGCAYNWLINISPIPLTKLLLPGRELRQSLRFPHVPLLRNRDRAVYRSMQPAVTVPVEIPSANNSTTLQPDYQTSASYYYTTGFSYTSGPRRTSAIYCTHAAVCVAWHFKAICTRSASKHVLPVQVSEVPRLRWDWYRFTRAR